MRAVEFRMAADSYSRHPIATVRIAMFSKAIGCSARAAKSYYYDERPIPRHVVNAIKSISTPRRKAQQNAALMVIAADLGRLADHEEAVRSFCFECEPDGFCRNASCRLRSISPLKLAVSTRNGARPMPWPSTASPVSPTDDGNIAA